MARNWHQVRDEVEGAGLIDPQRVAHDEKEMRGEVRAVKLAEIRKSHHVSQATMASSMGVAQPRVSAIERSNLAHTELGTLQSYVEALGGRLRVVADFGDESLTVRD